MKIESADWLLYAASELSRLQDQHEIVRVLQKVRVRVKNGVKEELLPLLKMKGIGRVRGRKLIVNGIRNLGDVKKVDIATLGQIVGKALASSLKKQVGEDVVVISPGKRKGQMSLEKY
ncbi:TPA: hypothetical protein HA278_06710 [Candidatus Woesearchaeota archaeon]|nr:hypothetical protein [Candidatus Woesearchaeota archaeon]